MRSAEEILQIEFNKKEYQMADYPFGDTKEVILSAIKTAQTEAIIEAVAVVKTIKTGNSGSWLDASIDTQSILQLLNQIK